MAEPRFADDDDLPRTLRREREAREREKRERELPELPDGAFGPGGGRGPAPAYGFVGTSGGAGTVTRLEIPFLHLVRFFLKAVVAAIPAMILLTVLLWGLGQGLKAFFPQFRHFEIVIQSTRP